MKISRRGKLWLAIAPLLITVAILIGIAAASMYALSGLRAFVGGEGLWSKWQKDAIHYLVRYARSADESDYQKYRTAIAVPLGDRKAREALDRPPGATDYETARQGFLEGRNHADDIESMSTIFVRFRNVSYIAKAIEIWAEGDRLIERVVETAEQLRAEVVGSRDPTRIEEHAVRLHALNDQLRPLEEAFSSTLGEASRWATGLLITVLVFLSSLLVIAAALLYGREINRTSAAEVALRESQDVLSLAMRGGRLGAWTRDLVTNEVWWSGELEELFGLPPGGFLRTTAAFRESVHEEDRAQLDKMIETALVTKSDYAVEFRFRHASGAWRWMDGRGRAVYGEDGRPTRLYGIGIDITERKQADETARLHEARFHTMADAIPQLAWIAKPDGWIYWYNQRWYEYTGTAATDMEGWGWQSVHDPDVLPLVMERWNTSIASGEPFDMVFPLRGADGVFRQFLTRVMPLKNEQGEVQHWFGTNTDITLQREAEEALRSADRRKNEFIATLAHELRNPLAPIRNAVEMIRLLGTNSPELGVAREIIDRQLRHLTRLVDDLLEMSRITRGKLQLRTERIELSVSLKDAVEAVAPLVQSAAQDLTVSLPDEAVYVQGDATRITQIVLNLLNNAVKFTPRGGQIWLTVARQGVEVLICVRDTGVGIPAEHLSHIFEMFSQLSPAIERTEGGLGIGLALVRGLVELHGGTVRASSAGLGKGSEFVVRLPLAFADESSKAASLSSDALTQADVPRRILVVDDNRDAASSLCMLLQLLGHEVREAHDGVEAIHAAEVFRPHVVLLDIGLPKLNGYDVARELRQRVGHRSLRIVAVTGWGQDEDKRRSAEAGFDLHLTKPVDAKQLQRMISENQTVL